MAVDQKIVDRVKKLFALAGNNINEHEAERAMERAHALMKEHGIAMADVSAGDKPEMTVDGWESEWKPQVDTYARILSQATAELFNCETWTLRSGKHFGYRVKVCFAGEETDLALCVDVWPYLVKIAKSLAKNYAGPGWDARHRSFCEAFALRVHARAEQMSVQDRNPEKNDGVQSKQDQCYALVLVNKDAMIQKWFEDQDLKLKRRNTNLKGETDHRAVAAGDEAGKRVNLNFRGQVGNSNDQPKQVR